MLVLSNDVENISFYANYLLFHQEMHHFKKKINDFIKKTNNKIQYGGNTQGHVISDQILGQVKKTKFPVSSYYHIYG